MPGPLVSDHSGCDRTELLRVVGTPCWRDRLGDQTVQLLVHGRTASRIYWGLPLQPQIHSYVRRATQVGFATDEALNLERIAIGASARPPGADVTVTSNAFVAHRRAAG